MVSVPVALVGVAVEQEPRAATQVYARATIAEVI
jgi:hypothetical protein